MASTWQDGCLRIELMDGSQPMEERRARFFIGGDGEAASGNEIESEGLLGMQLAHFLHACTVLSSAHDEAWYVPNRGRPLYLRRRGRAVEIGSQPAFFGQEAGWLEDGALHVVDFGMFVESLSAAVEWLINNLSEESRGTESVELLILQWEQTWEHFAQLVTFRRFALSPA
ncbi:MAG: hypothetical protein KDD73_10425 [Anaerolineales bacterium]|nr:hypothetical protein [Anaerolineales bacterium]MCB9127719.1 hypothetical protein [Ardenticatenales bacterium]